MGGMSVHDRLRQSPPHGNRQGRCIRVRRWARRCPPCEDNCGTDQKRNPGAPMTLPPVRVSKHHEVPTHLNVEDKVVFGLSVRQFLYMLVGSSASYTPWEQAAA